MSFKDVLSQDQVINAFRNAALKKQISHAYILAGQKGVGKSLFAKEFTKYLFCKTNEDGHCDICQICKRIDSQNHPDVHWTVLDKKDKFIKIDDIREIQHFVKLSPVESENKIFIIKDAERMNEDASNCLLKTLEEPTPNTIIILISNFLAQIKDTIKSRCQIVRFSPIPTHIIREQLVEKYNADAKEADWVSRFCCGSLGNAIDLIRDKFYEKYDYIVKRVSVLKLEDNLNFADEITETLLSASETLEEKRQALKGLLNYMLQYYRDLLLLKIRKGTENDYENLTIFDLGGEDAKQTQSNQLKKEQIIHIIDEIILTVRHIDYNLNISLLIENIITKIAVLNTGNTVKVPS